MENVVGVVMQFLPVGQGSGWYLVIIVVVSFFLTRPAKPNPDKKRKLFNSLGATILAPGTGQIYNGEVRERRAVLMIVQYTLVNVNDPKSILW